MERSGNFYKAIRLGYILISILIGCMDISEVISKITKPFKIDPTVFSSYTFKNATLYVPSGTVNIYKNIEFWNQFSSVEEIR